MDLNYKIEEERGIGCEDYYDYLKQRETGEVRRAVREARQRLEALTSNLNGAKQTVQGRNIGPFDEVSNKMRAIIDE